MRSFFSSLATVLLLLQGEPIWGASNEPRAKKTEGSPRIVNGDDAPIDRFPYMVSLQVTIPNINLHFQHICGGTLIAPDIVLSAAHCAIVDDSEMLVRTNPHSRSDPADGSEVFAVVDSVLHPNFDDTAILENDIWVMKLDGRSSQPLARINEDPRIPIENQTLSAAGWGHTEFSSPDPLPDILQITDEMKYISNGQCLEVYGDLANATADNLLDQMIPANLMCVSSPTGQGICQGDSGGPVFIRGSTFSDDIQVGISSSSIDCAHPRAPAFFARVSLGFEFIRSQVCVLSDAPPDYFRCNEPLIDTTDSPTTTPAPSAVPSIAMLRMQFDGYPSETSVTIYDETGISIFEFDRGSFQTAETTLTKGLPLEIGKTYSIMVRDAYGDGLCCGLNGPGNVVVFLGDKTDYNRVLAYIDGNFLSFATADFTVSEEAMVQYNPLTAAPSSSPLPFVPEPPPSPEKPQNVTVVVNFDTFSSVDVGWVIYVNSPGKNGSLPTVYGVPPGTYGPFDGDMVTEVVTLDLGVDYTFKIYDNSSDGICCATGEGYAEIYFGNEIVSDNLLLFDRGDFGLSRLQNFTVSRNATISITESPSVAPTSSAAPSTSLSPTVSMVDIVIQIQLDQFANETGWILYDAATGQTVAEEPPGTYFSYELLYGSTLVNDTVSVILGQPYTFIVVDSMQNGIEDGYLAVFLKDAVANQVLVYIDGDFGAFQVASFVASAGEQFDSELAKSETDAPTLTPTFAPSESWFPSVATPLSPSQSTPANYKLTMVINVDIFFSETGVKLFPRGKSRRYYGFETGQLNKNLGNVGPVFVQEIFVNSSMTGNDFVLEVTDSYGDGMSGNVTIYYGDEEDGIILAFEGGNFGYKSTQQFFVPIQLGIANATPAPETALPITISPVTISPIDTGAPFTQSPVTVSKAPAAPVTVAPVTVAPITAAPIKGDTPITVSPMTSAPILNPPASPPPITSEPTSGCMFQPSVMLMPFATSIAVAIIMLG